MDNMACKACGKRNTNLYCGYCIKCFQLTKMKKDKEIVISDEYIEMEKGSTSVDDLFKMSGNISARKYQK